MLSHFKPLTLHLVNVFKQIKVCYLLVLIIELLLNEKKMK